MARDYYEVLGVSRTADQDEIQQAYRKLARRHHPDVNSAPEAEERFKEINEAYDVLSDPETRKRYDRFGPDFRSIPEGWEEHVSAGGGAGFGGGQRGARGARSSGGGVRFTTGDGGAGVDFEDLFGSMFGGRGAGGPIPGADQEAELELTAEEAYRGGSRTITLSGPEGAREYRVNVPRGAVDGQRIRLAGQGGHAAGGGTDGDLYLKVRIAPHPRYRLSGRDIYVDLPVTPWEAALGATVPLTTPGGEAKVTVPAGSSSGRRLRLRGEGMPRSAGAPGDLYAEVRVMVPSTPSERERELFEQLANESTFDPRR